MLASSCLWRGGREGRKGGEKRGRKKLLFFFFFFFFSQFIFLLCLLQVRCSLWIHSPFFCNLLSSSFLRYSSKSLSFYSLSFPCPIIWFLFLLVFYFIFIFPLLPSLTLPLLPGFASASSAATIPVTLQSAIDSGMVRPVCYISVYNIYISIYQYAPFYKIRFSQ